MRLIPRQSAHAVNPVLLNPTLCMQYTHSNSVIYTKVVSNVLHGNQTAERDTHGIHTVVEL